MHELRELKTSDCRLKESRWQDWRLGQAVKETGLQPQLRRGRWASQRKGCGETGLQVWKASG